VFLLLTTLICAAWSDQGVSGELQGQAEGQCQEDGSGQSCKQEALRDGDAFIQAQVLAKKISGKASQLSQDEDDELGDGVETDKELILEDFRGNLSECMYDMTTDIDDDARKEALDLIYQAEVLKKSHSLGLIDEENIVWAAVLGAQSAAQKIARAEARNALLETLAKHNMTNAIRDKFVVKLESLAHLCNDSADAAEIAADENQLLSTDGAPLRAGEAGTAMELAEYVISKCSAEALDLEWFFAHAASISNSSSCGTLIDQEIKMNLGDQAVVHDAHIQTVMALHNEENQLGHHYAKQLKHATDGIITHKEFALGGMGKLHNALISDLSKPTRAKLRYLENKNFPKLHGFTKRELCDQRDQLKAHDPNHYSLQSDTVFTKMYNCMCVDDDIFLVCQARHHDEIAKEQPHLFKRIHQATQEEKEARHRLAREKIWETSSVARANSTWSDPSGGGWCKEPIEGKICINKMCCGTSGNDANYALWGHANCNVDFFGLMAMLDENKLEIDASMSFNYGWPAVECAFKLVLTIGVTTSMSGHWTDVMVNFKFYIKLELCLGGTLGDIAGALGWSACQKLAEINYYPFIGKMTGTFRLPLFQISVASAWARLDIGGPVHDVTKAIKNIIRHPDHNAFRSACPGCPGTSAAALVSSDEISDDTANIDDAANLGFWRRRRRRRRDRRRRDRRRDICTIRPCNGGSAREYWKRKMEDARGGLSLTITGEACAAWWCWDLVSFSWKWGTPAISV